MSIYAATLEYIRTNPGKTAAEIGAGVTGQSHEQTQTDNMVQQLVTDGLVTQTGGTFSTATFAVSGEVT